MSHHYKKDWKSTTLTTRSRHSINSHPNTGASILGELGVATPRFWAGVVESQKGVVGMGGDLGETGGTVPQKIFEVGGRPMHPSSPIFCEVVLSDVRESTNRVKSAMKELFSEIGVFRVKKGSYMTFHTVRIWKILKTIGKILKTWSMTKKRSAEILGVKMEIFSKKLILVCEILFRPPQTRRFSQIFRIFFYYVQYRMTLSSQEQPLFQKRIPLGL